MTLISKTTLIISIFAISTFITAQEKETMLFGKVKNDTIPLKNIAVINKRTQLGTTSLANGTYYIKATLGDTILYTALAYKNRIVKISESHIKKRAIEVFLEPQLTQLDTVTIASSFKLDLSKVYIHKNMVLNNSTTDYVTPPSVINEVDPTMAQGGVAILGLLAKGIDALFLKKGRKHKKEAARIEIKKENFVANLVYHQTEPVFINELKIEKDNIYQFIDFCEDKGLKQQYNNSDIELKNFLIIQSKAFKALKSSF